MLFKVDRSRMLFKVDRSDRGIVVLFEGPSATFGNRSSGFRQINSRIRRVDGFRVGDVIRRRIA